jgi:SpoVK/Ycf46/Vps4 family AAA+-type ATPase
MVHRVQVSDRKTVNMFQLISKFTGKTMAAEAISFDLGCPLMVVNSAELVNKYIGETGKNIVSAFRDAKNNGSVLVFDEGEGLFGSRSMGSSSSSSSTSRHDNLNVGLLLQHIESFPGVCIVITNSAEAIDEAFFRRFNHVVSFEKPGARLRLKLWQLIIPRQCPLSADVSTERLANQFELTGGEIKSALLRAASRAALRMKESERVLRMVDLEESCTEELSKQQGKRPTIGMYM